MPDHLTSDEIDGVYDEIGRMLEKNPEAENDYILVDTIKGSVNIKFFKTETIEAMAKIGKVKANDVMMHMMYMQNKDNDVTSEQLRF